jgi:hypothetical protein
MQHTVPCNFCKNWFVVVLQKSVHSWQVLLHQLVLKWTVDVKFKTFLSSCLKRCKRCIIRKLNTFMSWWEVN